jgi:hypothetical protein
LGQEFCGSWVLRKTMRDKAINGGGMSMKEIMDMEQMYCNRRAIARQRERILRHY